MHRLTVQIDVSENDDELEKEICEKLRTIFNTSASLLDYCANSITVSNIENIEEGVV